jgi:sodium/potassium-transporting ATPase subunit alpha
MTPEQALEYMIAEKATHNSVSQLRALAGLCNAGEFDAATITLS